MKFFALVTFIFMQNVIAYEIVKGTNGDVRNGTEYFSYVCDETQLQNVEGNLKLLVDENKNVRNKLELIVEENENLHQKLNLIVDKNDNLLRKLDTFTSSINLQFTKFETAISNLTSTISILSTSVRQNESTNSISVISFDQMMDLLRNISVSKSYQKSDMKPTSCAEAIENGYKSGIYKIYLPEFKLDPFLVYCLVDPEQIEAPWTIVQRRQDGSVNFYRNWAEYQNGFGYLDGEFFIGLDKLHALTQSTPNELWIQMKDVSNNNHSANYSSFAIGNSSEAYALKTLGSFKGDVLDRLTYHAGQKFSTKDVDNDMSEDNCAVQNKGAWWYNDCWHSTLNAVNLNGLPTGVFWHAPLKYVHMALRPVNKTAK